MRFIFVFRSRKNHMCESTTQLLIIRNPTVPGINNHQPIIHYFTYKTSLSTPSSTPLTITPNRNILKNSPEPLVFPSPHPLAQRAWSYNQYDRCLDLHIRLSLLLLRWSNRYIGVNRRKAAGTEPYWSNKTCTVGEEGCFSAHFVIIWLWYSPLFCQGWGGRAVHWFIIRWCGRWF